MFLCTCIVAIIAFERCSGLGWAVPTLSPFSRGPVDQKRNLQKTASTFTV